MTHIFSKVASTCLAVGLASASLAASMTVTFAPVSAGDAAAVTATVGYSGVASVSNGTQVVVCYDNTKLTFGAVTYAVPPGETQASQEQAAGSLCVAPANRQVLLNYVSIGGTWPSNPAGSGTLAAAGNLATLSFTTSNPFVGSTSVVATENTALGGDYQLGNATGTLTRTVTPSTAVFSISNVTVTEAGVAADAIVTCTGSFASNTTTPVAVAYSTTNAAGNFSVAASPVSFTACGGQTRTIAVTPRGEDASVQGTVTGGIVLGAVTTDVGSTVSATASVVTVLDNDTPPVFSVAKAGACAEALAPTNCTFTITRDSGVASATTVNFTVTGTATRATDYVLKTGGCAAGTALTTNTVSHPDANALVIDVCPTDDSLVETGGETVIFTVTANPPTYTVGTASQTQNIADDDSPQVVTVSGGGAVAEPNGAGVFTFTRSGGSLAVQALPLTVNIGRSGTATYGAACTAGVDYMSSVTGTTVTITGGQSTVDVTVTACDDALIDPAETVIYAVAAPTAPTDYTVGSPASATATITDDDVAVNAVSGATGSALSTATAEGTIVRFSVSCPTLSASQQIDFAITPATAYPGDVYSGSPTGSVTCPAAAASLVAVPTTVQTINDTTIGNARTYTMTISLPVAMPTAASANGLKAGGPSVAATIIGNAIASVSVTDDDQPVVVPTMSMLGLGFMSLMLAGFVAFQRRRVQK